MTPKQETQLIDLLFEIRNAIERINEQLEDLISKEVPEKQERPTTREEARERRRIMESTGVVNGNDLAFIMARMEKK